ncbi:methyltransferase family protein [Georgenia yuyongxinii]|uniref:methyltransferase family protein n=1 Tax=Georgenia yuyongxinii TaxID=2589797 RepID=UPI00143DAD23|nr:isoprenylcysteine carboxylmethyltransferase family protein [Georgenia yuyongxinii]
MPGPRLVSILGTALEVAGSSMIAWAWLAARDVYLIEPGRLLTDGVYGRVRHPMYVGWALLYLGGALTSRNGWALAVLPVAVRIVHHEVLREERALVERFGTTYEKYQDRVPRYGLWVMPRG